MDDFKWRAVFAGSFRKRKWCVERPAGIPPKWPEQLSDTKCRPIRFAAKEAAERRAAALNNALEKRHVDR